MTARRGVGNPGAPTGTRWAGIGTANWTHPTGRALDRMTSVARGAADQAPADEPWPDNDSKIVAVACDHDQMARYYGTRVAERLRDRLRATIHIHRGDVTLIACDNDCPRCGYPETREAYSAEAGPLRVSCRVCGWEETA